MRLRTLALVASTLALLATGCDGCVAAYSELGPDLGDGREDDWRASQTGLIYQLASDGYTMYAVSLNAGIWRRRIGDRWKQLANSSPLATSLAVDPTSPRHLVSGDRNNPGTDSNPGNFDLSLSGLWESNDGGDTWFFVYSPLTRAADPAMPGYCANFTSQAIPAVAITPKGTILAGTPCGIVRRASGASTYTAPVMPIGIAGVTAFAIARTSTVNTLIWALARNLATTRLRLLWSDDDGATWTPVAFQTPVSGFGIPAAIGTAFSRGDDYSLAAFGDNVAMVFQPNPDQKNQTGVLYFNKTQGTFAAHLIDGGNDGTGWGGRRSIRAVSIKPPFKVGDGVRIFLNTGQGVFDGEGLDDQGRVKWRHQLTAHCGDCGDPDPMHADIWDVLPGTENDDFWIATDGGVYARTNKLASFNAGLFTHHIHNVSLLETPRDREIAGPRLDYATSDNDAWFSPGQGSGTTPRKWDTYSKLGDANWTAADRGNSRLSIEVRHDQLAVITDFGEGAPSGTSRVGGAQIGLSCVPTSAAPPKCAEGFTLPRNWKVVQTGPGLPYKTGVSLDVVWLASQPLTYMDGGTVTPLSSGTLATAVSGASNPVLLRNWAVAVDPDISSSKFKGWFVESGAVPAGMSRVWVSVESGHHPWEAVYYGCICDGGGTPQLFKMNARNTPWVPVTISVAQPSGGAVIRQLLAPTEDAGQVVRETTGPLWVDPLNPNRLVVLTTVGIAFSNNGGTTWTDDRMLTLLLTNSRQYPFATGYPAGSSLDVMSGTRGLRFMYASDVAFGWGDDQLAVASPFAGVFARRASDQPWLDLRTALPKPLPTVSSIAFWRSELVVATEGRGLMETVHYYDARLGAVFDLTASVRTGVRTLTLRRSDGAGIANAPVTVITITANGVWQGASVTTTGTGEVILPAGIATGTRVFLKYKGDSKTAPAETAFRT